MNEWKYYNHAFVPCLAPHETPDISCIKNRTIWKEDKRALMVRWTTDFDCGRETSWWFVIKDQPVELKAMSKTNRKHLRQALKKCEVKSVDPMKYKEELWHVYALAYERYVNAKQLSRDEFLKDLENSDCIYWAGFDAENGEMIGWMSCREHSDYVETVSAKYIPEHMNKRVSDAIHYRVIEEYLENRKMKYLSSGERCINHETNAQDYKINNWGFRKAYCHLHIAYRSWVAVLVKILYPFRKCLKKMDRNRLIHEVAAILDMEDFSRRRN